MSKNAPVSPPQPRAEPVRQHTPTPWNCAFRYSSVVGVPIVNQQGRRIGNTALPDMPPEWDDMKRQAEVDAAFICEAVNSHTSLKARAEQAEQAVDLMESNAREQAKLLADTGRRVEELEAQQNRLVDWAVLYASEGQSWVFSSVTEQLIALSSRAPTQADAKHFRKRGSLAAMPAPNTPAVSR